LVYCYQDGEGKEGFKIIKGKHLIDDWSYSSEACWFIPKDTISASKELLEKRLAEAVKELFLI
jgi:hypothetical protein